MKNLALLVGVYLAATAGAPAALYTYTYDSDFADSGNIPDGNVNPWTDTQTLGGIPDATITGVDVRLDVSGGFNGDLYAYLSYNGALVPLLNRPGVGTGNAFGYTDAGLDVTFTDGAANNIHFYQAVGGYSITDEAAWQPDGRTINPLTSAPSAFDAPETVMLSSFDGMNPNGEWTLVISDVSSGGGQAKVLSWGLDITAVPEPASALLLGLFGISFGLFALCRKAGVSPKH